MGQIAGTFIKWFLVTALLGIVVGGVVGGMIGSDFASSRQAGRSLGLFVWPTVLVISIVGTFFSVRRKRAAAQADASGRAA